MPPRRARASASSSTRAWVWAAMIRSVPAGMASAGTLRTSCSTCTGRPAARPATARRSSSAGATTPTNSMPTSWRRDSNTDAAKNRDPTSATFIGQLLHPDRMPRIPERPSGVVRWSGSGGRAGAAVGVAGAGDGALQFVDVDRLGEVLVEAGVEGFLAVPFLAVAGQGQHGAPKTLAAHRAPQFKTVDVGQADVEDGHVRLHFLQQDHGGLAVVGGAHLVAQQRQDLGGGVGGVDVVVDDHDAPSGGGRRARR